MPSPHLDALWRLATAQWAEITANSPDLAPAVFLQQRLLRLTLDASAGLAETPPDRLPAMSMREKWTRGLPALRNEAIAIPAGLKDILLPLCTALAECGAGESALHISDAIASGGIDADSLLGVSLARNQKAIRTSALHMGFSPDLVWLIGELGSAPLAHHLRRKRGLAYHETPFSTGTVGTARSAGPGRRSSKRTTTRTCCAARTARSGGPCNRTAASIAATLVMISLRPRPM